MGEAEGRKLIQRLVKELEQCLWTCPLVNRRVLITELPGKVPVLTFKMTVPTSN